MTYPLTAEARYRLLERLGLIYGDRPVPKEAFDDHASRAMRWQAKNDKDSAREPVTQ
jgi:hypothetical protein